MSKTPTPRTDSATLAKAMRILSQDIQSEDGVANAAIYEAADRIEQLERELAAAQERIQRLTEAVDPLAFRIGLYSDDVSFEQCQAWAKAKEAE